MGVEHRAPAESGNGRGRDHLGHERVLIVEDDAYATYMLRELLSGAGYAVTTTESALGTRGLARRLRPSVILLDLGLPYRSGALLLADLKADPATADIPILVVTGYPDALTAKRRTLVTDVIAKPFEPGALVEAVRALCDSRG